MQIGIDLAGHLRHLRAAGYEGTTFVAELIQNAQRAKAARIDFCVDADGLLVEDNGIGCSDPEQVFTLSRSGWDSQTVESENPFGEGFFSLLPAVRQVTVTSRGFAASWDIDRTIATGDLTVDVTRGDFPGFQILATWAPGVDIEAVRAAVRREAKFVPDVEIRLDGELLSKLDPATVERYRIQGTGFVGSFTFVPESGAQLILLHRGRVVRAIEELPHLRGAVEVSRGITLKAPDRKDIIKDGKWFALLARLRREVSRAADIAVGEVGDDGLEKLGYALAPYVTASTEEHICWTCLEGSDEELPEGEVAYEDDVAFVQQAARTATILEGVSPEILAAALSALSNLSEESGTAQEGPETSEASAAPVPFGVTGFPPENPARPAKRGLTAGFWMRSWELEPLKRLVGLCRYYRIPLFVVSDPVRTKILQAKKYPHLSSFEACVTFEHRVKIHDLVQLQPAWDAICNRIFGRKIALKAGKIKKTLTARIGSETIKRKLPVLAMADREAGAIVFAREAMWPARISGVISIRQFVLRNLGTLAHELAHLIFATADGTLEHYQMESRLAAALARAVASKEAK